MADPQRTIADRLPAPVIVVGENGRVLCANERCRLLAGSDLCGWDLHGDERAEEPPLLTAWRGAWRRGRSSPREAAELIVVPEGADVRYYWLTISGREPDGSRVLIAEEIGPALSGSEAMAAAVSHLAHDLRSPLTSVRGAAELMTSGRIGDLPPAQRRMVAIVEEGARRIEEILARARSRFAGPAGAAAEEGA